MGTNNPIRIQKQKKKRKMKVSFAIIAAVASAEEKKVPPRHPLQRLNRLVEFSEEILTDHFTFLPSQGNWIRKFAKNAERMGKNFERGNQRCGFYDESSEHGGPEPTDAPTEAPTEAPTDAPTEAPTEGYVSIQPATEAPAPVYTTKAPKKKGGNKKKGNKNKKEEESRYRRDLGDDFDRYDREDPAVGVK